MLNIYTHINEYSEIHLALSLTGQEGLLHTREFVFVMLNYLSHFAVHMRISFLYSFAVVRQLACVIVFNICEPNYTKLQSAWSFLNISHLENSVQQLHLSLPAVSG